MYIDTEYLTLECLNENSSLSQRQLSRILGISLGSVNMLLAKMQRDGLIKIKNISPCRVMYVLTPEGIAEKANKTFKYIARNYKYINDTKQKIKDYLKQHFDKEDMLYFLQDDSETSQMVLLAANELECAERLNIVKKISDIPENVVVLLVQDNEELSGGNFRTEVVLEKI